MGRGLIGGLFVGAILAIGFAGLLSVFVPLPRQPQISIDAPVTSTVPEGSTSTAGRVPADTRASGLTPNAPKIEAPVIDTSAPQFVEPQIAKPIVRPQTTQGAQAIAAPEVPTSSGIDVAVVLQAPTAPSRSVAPVTAPDAPATDAAIREPQDQPKQAPTGTDRAQIAPEAPAVVAPDIAQTADLANTPTDDPAAMPQGQRIAVALFPLDTASDTGLNDEPQAPRPQPADPVTDIVSISAPAVNEASPATPDAFRGPEPAVQTLPARLVVPGKADTVPNEPETAAAPPAAQTQTAEAEVEPSTPVVTTRTTQNATNDASDRVVVSSRIGKPARSLIQRDTAEPVIATNSTEPAADAAPVTTDGPAMDRFAATFENPEGQPLMSIVLLDTGQDLSTGPIGLAALSSFPYPITFAVDTSLRDAVDRSETYRAQGFEVMAMVDLPDNLTASDTEVALTAAMRSVPQAVAVMEGLGSGLQGSREMSDQVAEIMLADGHGIVWQPKGLDTAQKLAARQGVASRTLFRDFDGADQSAGAIRRFLDQAAFRAGQQDGVIMIGRLRPDTISALLLWGLQDRPPRVAVAPVSAVLKAGVAGQDG